MELAAYALGALQASKGRSDWGSDAAGRAVDGDDLLRRLVHAERKLSPSPATPAPKSVFRDISLASAEDLRGDSLSWSVASPRSAPAFTGSPSANASCVTWGSSARRLSERRSLPSGVARREAGLKDLVS